MPAKKATAKKTTRKKATVRKTSAKKATKQSQASSSNKLSPVATPWTKTQLLGEMATAAGVTKQQAKVMLEELGNTIHRHVKNRSAGQFTLPGLLKINVIRKPATKARKGINPFTKEPTVFKAKPARKVVKIRPLKALKEMVS